MAAPQPHGARPLPACPSPQAPENRRAARCLLQLKSGVKATGDGAEAEGVAHVFDFPTRPRCVDACVASSDAVKGSHVQRSPLSMGAQLSEPEESVSSQKTADGSLVSSKYESYPNPLFLVRSQKVGLNWLEVY